MKQTREEIVVEGGVIFLFRRAAGKFAHGCKWIVSEAERGGETDLGETSDFCCALFGHRLFRLVNFLKRIQTFLLQNEHQFQTVGMIMCV